ncbi:hypothetical protein BC833DRAFT_443455 [Globomyces pollinis-pini]|nr:hypothetical protein BC833DRAFT_443455 [Globomyces pollinis-pini]
MNESNGTFYSGIQARLQEAAKVTTTIFNNNNNNTSTDNNIIDTSVDTNDQSELEKLKSRFIDLARAYKSTKQNYDNVVEIINKNSNINQLSSQQDLNDLASLLKASTHNFNADRDITKLVDQINKLKSQHELDLDTNADLYAAQQAQLIAKEEEINKLKHRINKLDALTAGSDSPDSPASSNDPLYLKLKIRELSTALKNVASQRNTALQKLKGVSPFNSPSIMNPSPQITLIHHCNSLSLHFTMTCHGKSLFIIDPSLQLIHLSLHYITVYRSHTTIYH